MLYRLRMLLIVLVLLEFGLFMLPETINLPGGIVGWLVFMHLFWGIIPCAIIAVLSITFFTYFSEAP